MTAQPRAFDADAWSTAVPDWADRVRSGRSLVPDLPLHDGYAQKALRIFKGLRIPDIEGFPTYGEVCAPFVFDFVAAVFGSYDPETRQRHLREFFLQIPKKNAKTAIAAAIIVTACILNEAPQATFVLIAPSIPLAEGAFSHIEGIIKRTERLAGLFHLQPSVRTIQNLNPDIPSSIRIKAADGDIITGVKNSTFLIDETHQFGKRPMARGLFTEIRGALSHPTNRHFLLQITTQSKEAPAGVYKSELASARAVRDGAAALPLLPVIYELPEDMVAGEGWKDEATWPLVNPHLGRSVSIDFLRDELRKAEDDGAEAIALLASQHFNVEIGTAQWGDGWSAQRHWDAAADPALTLQALLGRAEAVTIGVDGGGEDDLCGLAVIGREAGSRRWLAWGHAWAQPDVLERRKSIAPRLQDFARAGELTICDAPYQHVEEVVEMVRTVAATGKLPETSAVGLDQAGLPELTDALEAAGFGHPVTVGVPQGWRLSAAIKSLPLRLKAGQMRHGGQALMGWSVGNARVELRGSNLYMTKQTAGAAKIDPVIALLNAAMLMFLNPVAAGSGQTPWDADPDFRIAG